ncbi:MAG TPA: PAS domain S-box protein [Acidimicrobiales bacterium]|nr:PAS domain S-box protein [Acidimicrobiales bacterium]
MGTTPGSLAQAFIAALADPTLLVDVAGTVHEANDAAARAFRCAGTALVGMRADALLPGLALAAPVEGAGADLRPAPEAAPAPTRLTARRPDGSSFAADAAVGLLHRGQSLVVVRDLEARATAEHRAAELAAAVQASTDAIYVQGTDGLVTSWNRAAERTYGYGASEAVGRPAAFLIPPHRSEDVVVFERVMHGERVEGYETEQRRRDGTLVPVWLTVLPVYDLSGRVVGATYAARDVTELELAQATLADAQARLRQGEALAHAGGWEWDVQTDTMQWSDELYRIHGVDPLDFEGTLDARVALVAGPDVARVREALVQGARQRWPIEIEYAIVRPDGGARQVLTRAQPIEDAMGAVTGLRGVDIDLTERHEVEHALQMAVERERAAAEELRAADRLKDDFLSTVSHELRTPLTSIVGFAALLESGDETLDDETRAHLVHRIGRNAVQMHNMIEGLLDFTRLQAGRVELRVAPTPLAGHIRSCVTGMAAVLADHTVDVAVPEEVTVAADAAGLDRILTNLLSNAAKFGPPGSTIEVRARPVPSPPASEEGPAMPTGGPAAPMGAPAMIEVSVRDQGPGVPSEHRERVFERFFQLAPSHTGKRGTGVGLAVVRQYVELLGGRVWCESAPGRGATFLFTLPAATP